MSQLPYIVPIYSAQGGSGKTTVTVNVATALSDKQKRVLVVAVQQDALTYLDVPIKDFAAVPPPVSPSQFVKKDKYLSVYTVVCRTDVCIDNLLNYLQSKRRWYDYILIDLNNMAEVVPSVLAHANRIIIPYRLDPHPTHALRSVLENIVKAERQDNSIRTDIFITQVDERTKVAEIQRALLVAIYGPWVFKYRTAETTYEDEAAMKKEAFVKRFSGQPNAEVYRKLAKELWDSTPPVKARSML